MPVTATASQPTDLTVSITGTNAPVTANEFLTVTATIRNEGLRSRTVTVRLVVGHDPDLVDSEQVTIPGGGQQTVDLGYSTYPVQTDVQFPVRVEANGAVDQQPVQVFAAPPAPSPSPFQH